MLRLHFDEQVHWVPQVLLLNFAQVVAVVGCQDVPKEDHAVFPGGDHPILSLHTAKAIALGHAASVVPSQHVHEAVLTTARKPGLLVGLD